jgi:hypothetical protein
MLKPQATIAAAMLVLSGCAAIGGMETRDSENILAEAGFTREVQSAAPGATAASGSALPARQLTRVAANGTTAYEFYDPNFCHCVYVGGPDEYAKLQQLRSARLDEHARNLRSWNPTSNSPDPNVWGPWEPEGLDVK